jgi:uncharacterized membrane protein
MPAFTIFIGVVMIALGAIGFIATSSVTSLIPAFFGAFFEAFGVLALFKPDWRKHMMHAAALLSLIGFAGIIGRVVGKLPALFAGQPVEPSALAVWLQLTFSLLCLVYLVACIRSFVMARFASPKNNS